MLSRDSDAVARDTDEADQALILRTDDSLEDAAGSECCLPLGLVDEVVQLNQINVIGAKPLEGPGDLRVCLFTLPFAGLGRQKEVGPVRLHPGPDPELCVTITRGRVDVIDAVPADQLHRVIRFGLTDVTEGRGSEDGARAVMSCASELQNGDHGSHCALWRVRLGVRRICGDGALPPDLPFLALELACVDVEPIGTVLDHQGIGIRLEVVIPVRMLRSAALRGHHGVRAVVLHPHQGNLPDLAALPAPGREDHHRQRRATQRICLAPVRGFVALNLFSNPRQRTWLVVSIQRHASLLSAQAASVRMTSAIRRASPISITICQTMLPEASRTNEPRSAQPSCSSNTSYVLATAPCGQ